jgi:hypothetical protein
MSKYSFALLVLSPQLLQQGVPNGTKSVARHSVFALGGHCWRPNL